MTYGPAQVKAQIAAARADGIDEFLLWDAEVTYDRTGLAPTGPDRTAAAAAGSSP